MSADNIVSFIDRVLAIFMHACSGIQYFLLLLLERLQKTFEGKLIGADRAKDLAVLKVDVCFSSLFFNIILQVISTNL